jgi:hypothetical protein
MYIVLSLVCYGLLVSLGGSPGTIVTIALIATDQVTDILYAWYSLFAQPYLLYLAFFFCLSNLGMSLIYLLWYLRFNDLLVVKWLKACSDAYDAFDAAYGQYNDHHQPKYSAWVLHSILGFRYGKFFPFSLLFIPFEILWILLRLFIMLIIIVSAIISQTVFLLIGVALYVNKLMSVAPVYVWFWSIWNPGYLEAHPLETGDDATVVYNALVLVEVFSECIPQIVIQVTNTTYILGRGINTWPVLTILSLTLSLCMVVSIVHHFLYEHNLLLDEDPTYTSFQFRRIPKFDLFVKFTEFTTNRRALNNNHNPPPQNQQPVPRAGSVQPLEVEVCFLFLTNYPDHSLGRKDLRTSRKEERCCSFDVVIRVDRR